MAAGDFRNADILEVGAGDGRLTLRYAGQVNSVVGVDTKEPEIRLAAKLSVTDCRQARFLCASGVYLPFRGESFGIALLGSSL